MSNLLLVPSPDQIEMLKVFEEQLRNFIATYDQTVSPNGEVSHVYDAALGKLIEYITILADLHSSVLVHQCTTETFNQICDANAIKSSREITIETGQPAGQSAFAKKYGGLPYVTFALNGTDPTYGYPTEQRASAKPDQYAGAVILLPITSLGNRPFFVAGKNLRNSGHQTFDNEIHVYPEATGSSQENDKVSVPLTNATVILPYDDLGKYEGFAHTHNIHLEGYGDNRYPDYYINQMKRAKRSDMIRYGLAFSFALRPHLGADGHVVRMPVRLQALPEPLFRLAQLKDTIRIQDMPSIYTHLGQARPIIR